MGCGEAAEGKGDLGPSAQASSKGKVASRRAAFEGRPLISEGEGVSLRWSAVGLGAGLIGPSGISKGPATQTELQKPSRGLKKRKNLSDCDGESRPVTQLAISFLRL